jgi:very-short-patch-repair endonuclease
MIHPTTLKNSRTLRKNLTPHERKLWYFIRNRRLAGFKFHRQFVVGPYIVDFCCYEKKLVIELDGGGHAEKDQESLDAERDHYLRKCGYTVLRIWNNDLIKNQQGVLDEIFRHFNGSPHP